MVQLGKVVVDTTLSKQAEIFAFGLRDRKREVEKKRD